MMDWLNQHGSMMVLLTFFAIFMAFGFWAYRPANKTRMQRYGDIPLKETHDGQ